MASGKLICLVVFAAALILPPVAGAEDRSVGTAVWIREYTDTTPPNTFQQHLEIQMPVDYSYEDPIPFDFSSEPVVSGTFESNELAPNASYCDKNRVGNYVGHLGHTFRPNFDGPGYFWLDMTVHGEGILTTSGPQSFCSNVAPAPYEFDIPVELRCGTTYVPQDGYAYPIGFYNYKTLANNGGGNCTGNMTFGVAASPPGLDVRISPVAAATSGETFPLKVTVRNTSTTENITNIKLAYPHGFGVANSYYPAADRGDIQVVSGPTPKFPTSLGAGQSSVHTISMRATTIGKVGLEAKAEARGATSNTLAKDTGYGEVVIGETQPKESERTAMVAAGAAMFLNQARVTMRDQEARYAKSLFNALKKRLSAKAQKFYFGAKGKLKITQYEQALARLKGMPAELMALATPNKQKLFKDGNVYLNEQQFARFQQMHNAEMLRLTGDFLGKTGGAIAQEASYWAGVASVEGQGRIAADLALWREMNAQDGDYLLQAISDSFSAKGASRALAESNAALQAGFEEAVNKALEAREARIGKLTKLAERDPDAFIEAIADDSAKMGFEGLKLMSEQLMGEAAFRLAGKVFSGARAAVARFTEGIGAGSAADARTLAKTTALGERSATLGPTYIDDLSKEAKTMISLRRMEDIGGMPIADVEITQEIVDKANDRLRQLGYDAEAEVLFRPSSPYKVEDAFAKVETVGVKNIAPIDLALGAPPSILAETAIFKPIKPESLPGWKGYSDLDQILLKERYKTRLSEFNQFHGIEPVTDKKMKEMLKAFDEVHIFDNIGQGREIRMKLSTEKVKGATVLKYDYLKVEGKVLINGKGKPRSIGSDFDQAAIIDKNTRQLLKGGALTAVESELRRLGEKAAIEKGYANPFHGATAHGTDANAADYPFFAHFWLTHLKEADAIREAQRLAANYNRGRDVSQHITAAQILSKTAGLYGRHLLRINAAEASFGPAGVVFRTPVVAP
ncbi:MAG: hypothetical protein ACSLFI_07355 [Solirubrobacterales bacterium]